jgi:membrane AbrB-like protein
MRLKVPVGALMGALTATVAVQAIGLTSVEPAPPRARNALYAAVGLMIGLRVNRSSLWRLRGIALPALLVPAVMIFGGILLGFLYATLTPDSSRLPLDLKTAVLAITPGGFQEIAIAAQQMNAVLSIVVVTHMVRILTVLYTYPRLVSAIVRYAEGRWPATRTTSRREENPASPKERTGVRRWGAVVLGAAIGGLIGAWSNIPAGTVVFAMLGTAAAKTGIAADSASLPQFARIGIQAALGTSLGLQFSLGPLARAGSLVAPLAASLVLLIAVSLATGLLIYRLTRTDLTTALWMSAPGGLMEIAVMADAMEVETLPVLTVHTMRVVLIIAIQPSLVLALSGVL